MRTAIDTNVISALWSGEPSASHMSALLAQVRRVGSLVVCAPVYAELLAHPKATRSFVDNFLSSTNITIDFALDEIIWRDVAVRFAAYAERRRHAGGAIAKRLLADFIVGGHALHRADQLLTLDPTRYERDFPTLTLMPVAAQ